MGYFPNSSAGADYFTKWCERCVHDINDSCPVWMLHLMDNYEECNKPDSYLHQLIPLSADKLDNERCRMFVDRGLLSNLALQQYATESEGQR